MQHNAQTEGKNLFDVNENMNWTGLQINEDAINESFESTNDVFDGFRIFTSDLFVQITDWINEILGNLLK